MASRTLTKVDLWLQPLRPAAAIYAHIAPGYFGTNQASLLKSTDRRDGYHVDVSLEFVVIPLSTRAV